MVYGDVFVLFHPLGDLEFYLHLNAMKPKRHNFIKCNEFNIVNGFNKKWTPESAPVFILMIKFYKNIY